MRPPSRLIADSIDQAGHAEPHGDPRRAVELQRRGAQAEEEHAQLAGERHVGHLQRPAHGVEREAHGEEHGKGQTGPGAVAQGVARDRGGGIGEHDTGDLGGRVCLQVAPVCEPFAAARADEDQRPSGGARRGLADAGVRRRALVTAAVARASRCRPRGRRSRRGPRRRDRRCGASEGLRCGWTAVGAGRPWRSRHSRCSGGNLPAVQIRPRSGERPDDLPERRRAGDRRVVRGPPRAP